MSDVWMFDPQHSAIRFSVRWLMVGRVSGTFNRWGGSVKYDPKAPLATQVSLELESATVDTGIPDRDTHLRTDDFFGVERFPKITFASSKVTAVSEKRLQVAGLLKIRDASKEVTLDVLSLGTVSDPWGKERAGFQVRSTFNRRDFGLTWGTIMSAGAEKARQKVEVVVVGEMVDLEADIILTRQ